MSLPISLAFAFRNEAKRIPHLLASVAGIVSEVVYADNASEDGSEEIVLEWCEGHGVPARGFMEPNVCGYPEPFFQRVFDLATQPWTLLCGADEVLTGDGAEFLRLVETGDLPDTCALRWGSVIIGSYDGTRPMEMLLFFEYQLRLWRTGSVWQAPHIHTPAHPLLGRTSGRFGDTRPYLQQVKSGHEQLSRDQARGQHLTAVLPEVNPYAHYPW